MRFKGLDLNLLVAFDALMEQRNVSAAARHMNLSQPAMSAALSRLRLYFNNELLVSHGKRMYPTAYAESLLPIVRDSLRRVDDLIATSATFDPATSQRSFRIICSDYIITAIIARLARRLSRIAPGIRIDNILPGDGSEDLITQGKADIMITPDEFTFRDHPTELLMEERHVLVGWRDNPLFQRRITKADFMSAGHVDVRMGDQHTTVFAGNHLEALGYQRQVEITTASFTTVPWLLIETMRLAIMHERLAVQMSELFPIAIAPLPFEFPMMREVIQFNQARANDEGLAWLRDQIRELAHRD